MNVPQDLRFVRRQLDYLTGLRLQRALNPESLKIYHALCDRERELLVAAGAV